MTHDDHLREQMGLPTLHGVEVVVLDDDELVLHRPVAVMGRRFGAVMCEAELERFTVGPAPALEPWARSLCSDCWPASDGPL